MCFYKKTLAKNLGVRASCSAKLPRGRPPGRVNLTDSKSMKIAIMSASSEILLDGASGPTSRLGQFRTRAGCKLRRFFIYFSAFGLFSQTKTRGGRPGLGRLYNRRDLAPTSHGILKTHYFSKLYVPPASPLGDPHLKSGSAGIWVTRHAATGPDWRGRPRGFRRLRNQQISMAVSKTPQFRKFRNSTNFGIFGMTVGQYVFQRCRVET